MTGGRVGQSRAARLLLAAGLLAGCRERFLETEHAVGGGPDDDGGAAAGGGPAMDASAAPPRDLAAPIERPPLMDLGGRCVPTGGPETCNGRDDDCNGMVDDVTAAMLEDVLACGSCDVVCTTPPNAIARCQRGQCGHTCVTGAVDVNRGVADGCECLITNGGTEICDGRDNDCNGTVDDGFDLQRSVNHCGVCNKRCIFPFAQASCANGGCVMGACLAGFYDRNRDARDGCEIACGKTAGGIEICDGVDNDCDGQIDNGVRATVACKAMGVCAGSRPECKGAQGWVCSYPADQQDNEDGTRGCDGKDNDCDGRTDEAFEVGKSCSVGTGACAATGMLVCDPTDTTRMRTRCSATPRTAAMEICNGQDDDCDGKTDELESLAERTADDKLVHLGAPHDVTMFAHEAARFDATDTSAGIDGSRRPCSVAGRLPWANVTQEEARLACRAVGPGWRLCTKDEWFAACRGFASTIFPYGSVYGPNKCNGYDYVPDREAKNATTVATGAAAMCLSDWSVDSGDELFDMSGNLKEWVLSSDPAADPPTYEMRGGAYNVASFGGTAPGLQCDAAIPAPKDVGVRLPSVGFRCCLPGRLR